MESGDASKAEHLAILVHGLWGKPLHLNHLKDTLQEQYSDGRLYILVANSNAEYFTYDGIELGGERIADEVEQKIEELATAGAKLRKISVIGYSLGGLIARYTIGLLYKNGVFDKLQPTNFSTFATPHLGVRSPTVGYGGNFWNTMGAKTLSTSGEQMFLADKFRDTGKPLLSLLADPNSIFIKGLSMFENKSVYSNTINDRSVPWYTAGISRVDPFIDLDAIDLHYLPGQGNEEVILDPSHPVSPKPTNDAQLTLYERYTSFQQRTLSHIPFYAVLTVLLPIGVPFFLANAGYQTYKSAQRVRLHEEGKTNVKIGRYRIPLLEEAQAMQDRVYNRLDKEDQEQYLPTSPPEAASSSTSASASSTDLAEEKALAQKESKKEDSPFPILALSPEQFEMIDGLDSIGITKYPVHIQKVRHTHAAIVVRTPKESFSEGRVVSAHWARNFVL